MDASAIVLYAVANGSPVITPTDLDHISVHVPPNKKFFILLIIFSFLNNCFTYLQLQIEHILAYKTKY